MPPSSASPSQGRKLPWGLRGPIRYAYIHIGSLWPADLWVSQRRMRPAVPSSQKHTHFSRSEMCQMCKQVRRECQLQDFRVVVLGVAVGADLPIRIQKSKAVAVISTLTAINASTVATLTGR
jgi:hypothetical protein